MAKEKNETPAGKKTSDSTKRKRTAGTSSSRTQTTRRKTTGKKTRGSSRTVLTKGVADISRDKTAKRLSTIERERKKRARQISRIKTTAVLLAVFFGLSAALLFVKVNFFTENTSSREQIANQDNPEAGIIKEKAEKDIPEPDSPPSNPPAHGTGENRSQNETKKPENSGPAETTGGEDYNPVRESGGADVKPETAPEDNASVEKDMTPAADASNEILIPEGNGVLCFVFDDAGHNTGHLEPFLELPFSCTIAVLPGLPHSAECASKIRGAGKELFLHQPMQAVNLNMDPGPGAILPGMTTEEIHGILEKNLEETGPVSGMNNHEGSLITADREAMKAVFDIVEEKSIFFLDSRTNAKTTAPEIARERGVKIWERDVFLDNSQDKAEITKAVLGGLEIASKKGYAIMIGHVWSEELAGILLDLYPRLLKAGYSVCDISELQTRVKTGEM